MERSARLAQRFDQPAVDEPARIGELPGIQQADHLLKFVGQPVLLCGAEGRAGERTDAEDIHDLLP